MIPKVLKDLFDSKLFKLWLLILPIKLALGVIVPFAADENYYWVWSQHPQWSYFDHPGMVSWLFWIGNHLSFIHGFRFPLIFLGHSTVLVWLLILKELKFTFEQQQTWFWLACCSPLLGFGSVIATPDVPLVFFWSLSFYWFILRLEKSSALYDALLGLSLGLGFCSKYHICLFVLVGLIYLLKEKKLSLFSGAAILRIVLFGLLGCLPVLVWNFQNDFVSFKYQLNHGFSDEPWDPFWTYSYPLGQILILFPVVFYYLMKSWKKAELSHLKIFSWGVLSFFFISSFRGLVEMNWPITGHPGLLALAARQNWSIKWLKVTCGTWLILAGLLVSQLIHPWIPGVPEKIDEFSAYEEVLKVPPEMAPLYGENYQMASYIWFQTKNPFYKLNSMSRPDFFDHLEGSLPTSSIFYVAMDKDAHLPEWLTARDPQVETVKTLNQHLVVNKITLSDVKTETKPEAKNQ